MTSFLEKKKEMDKGVNMYIHMKVHLTFNFWYEYYFGMLLCVQHSSRCCKATCSK
jgi:hypothetical protein